MTGSGAAPGERSAQQHLQAHYSGEAGAFRAFRRCVERDVVNLFEKNRQYVAPVQPHFLVEKTFQDIAKTKSRKSSQFRSRKRKGKAGELDAWVMQFATNVLHARLYEAYRTECRDDCFDELYRFWMDVLVTQFRQAEGMNAEEAQEAAQEILTRVALSAKKRTGWFRGDSPFSEWIATIAKNHLTDEGKKGERFPSDCSVEDLEEDGLYGTRADQLIAFRRPTERRAIFNEIWSVAVRCFPTTVRKALGYSSEELGNARGATANAINVQTHHEAAQLRAEFGDEHQTAKDRGERKARRMRKKRRKTEAGDGEERGRRDRHGEGACD